MEVQVYSILGLNNGDNGKMQATIIGLYRV